jgi:hypothetical protein
MIDARETKSSQTDTLRFFVRFRMFYEKQRHKYPIFIKRNIHPPITMAPRYWITRTLGSWVQNPLGICSYVHIFCCCPVYVNTLRCKKIHNSRKGRRIEFLIAEEKISAKIMGYKTQGSQRQVY